MGRETQSFKAHTTRTPFYKKSGALAALALFLALGAGVAACFKADEATILTHVKAKSGRSAPAALLLGLRGVKTDATRDALEALIAAHSGNDATPEDLRRASCYALGTVRQAQVVFTLADASKDDPSGIVRAAAVRALGNTGEMGAAEPIVRALDDTDSSVRVAAAQGAGTLKDQRALDKLIDRLNDANYDVRRACQRALIAITGEDFELDAAAWRKWREQH